LNLPPVEAVMLVEASILGGDYGVLEIGRNLGERKEIKPFLIGPVMNPGLQSALDVHCSCRWVDPPDGNKQQRGDRPKNQCTEDKPSTKGSEETLPKLALGGRGWP
jgi:hypothetical protein